MGCCAHGGYAGPYVVMQTTAGGCGDTGTNSKALGEALFMEEEVVLMVREEKGEQAAECAEQYSEAGER